jgi:ATP-dependent RNA helicase RhlE
MYFDELDLNDNVLDALYDMHFDDCTPIQEKCIPEILKGKDLLGIAQTGTGKTAAYLLPILSMLDDGGYPKNAINCIIMSPTRELAQQIDQAMQGFSYYLEGVSSVAIYGGNDGNRYDQEIKSLRLGADVVIATPGRFISHITMGNVDMSKVSFFVLDEADRMLDMGFSEDILSIAKKLPPTCQTVMFSATMPSKIEKLAQSLLKDPVKIKLAVSKPAEKIQQSAYVCYEPQKLGIIRDLFKSNSLKRVIIFSGKKDKVKDISRQLRRMHINAGEMHSDLSQAERDETMYRFKSEQIDVLVATDIVARGIDIDDIAMVINYDVPHDVEDYVHRIGRTARADKDGIAITFVNDNDIYYFMQIEQFLEKTITKNPLPQELGDGPQYVSHGKPRNGSNGRGHGNGASGGKGRGRGHGNGGHGQKSRGNNSSSSTNKSADHRGQQHRRKPTESNSK